MSLPSRSGERKSEREAHGTDLLQLVSFHLDSEEFGLEILKVQEIIRIQDLTRVPNSPAFVEGVLNLRGKVIPVVSLRKRFGLAPRDYDKDTRIVVTEVGGAIVGFVVDSVSEVLRISPETVEPAPRLGKVKQEFISGVGKLDNRLLILLNVERIMTEEETLELSGHTEFRTSVEIPAMAH